MMVVPQLSPAGLQTATVVTPPTPPVGSGVHTPLILQQGVTPRELQIVGSQHQGSAVSASGGTVHHMGQSPARCGVALPAAIPLANTIQPRTTNMSQQQQQQQPRAADAHELLSQLAQQSQLSLGQTSQCAKQQQQVHRLDSTIELAVASGGSVPRLPLTERSAFSVLTPPNVDLSSLTPSPERPRKRMKLDLKPAASDIVAHNRQLMCDHKLQEIKKLKENYKEHLTELFFLQQHGRNLMDYHAWKRRPTVPLVQFLKTARLDSDDEDEEQEKSINNEVHMCSVIMLLDQYLRTNYDILM